MPLSFSIRDLDPETSSPSGAGAAGGTAGAASGTPQLSPSVVVIIVLITVVFFLSGFLHLLARCFARPSASTNNGLSRRNNSSGSLNSLQGQLQHLFHLHDSGVEQAFIDALPVFLYRAVRGLKEGADCAVCLNEFSGDDRLRLLPKCSHAFHIECIDTWLLSHSTCPLCRCSLVPDASSSGCTAAVPGGMRVESFGASSSVSAASFGAESSIAEEGGVGGSLDLAGGRQESLRVLPVKLGRFCPAAANSGEESTAPSETAALSRRSYSMGSYEYVLDPSTGGAGGGEQQQVALVVIAPTPMHRKWPPPRGTPGHRAALSECIPEREGGSPWVTIDIDPRPMLAAGGTSRASSFLSWAPWRRNSKAPSSVGEKSFDSDKVKSFSFRLNVDQGQQQHEEPQQPAVWWWKNRGSSHEQQGSTAGGTGGTAAVCSWDQASVCSTNAEMKSTGSATSSMTTVSIARRTLQWLMGRDKHHHRSSAEEITGH
ncbi:RING-H2 finger protein ATL46-like [Selaginella moellendorffii]|uniref:RING-H2 finger protein ATL46-like n=1 Tax=Selaginella moellendorffii TaxID=88036 RepID=UPI000D1CFACD|nr:RING-H2 finger protein ATL46-like [Selaginella moellendorffii]|eukprot:XP_024531176.1 RING-H2 finger protein ATL46-like [Selaginella moellendorffii]